MLVSLRGPSAATVLRRSRAAKPWDAVRGTDGGDALELVGCGPLEAIEQPVRAGRDIDPIDTAGTWEGLRARGAIGRASATHGMSVEERPRLARWADVGAGPLWLSVGAISTGLASRRGQGRRTRGRPERRRTTNDPSRLTTRVGDLRWFGGPLVSPRREE